MHTRLNALVQVEQRQAFADPTGRHTDAAGDAGLGSAGVDEAAIGSSRLNEAGA